MTAARAGGPPPRVHYGYVVLGTGTLIVMGVLGFARFGYPLILPAMRAGLGLSYGQMGLLAMGNFLGYMVVSVAGGLLAWRFGPRAVAAAGTLVTALGMGLTGFVPSFGGALAARALTGVGSGAGYVPTAGLAAAWFGTRRRGLATGALVAGNGLGLIIAGTLLPPVLSGGPDGWRAAWWLLAGLVAGIAVLAGALLRDDPAVLGLAPVAADAPPRDPPAPGVAAAPGVLPAGWRPLLALPGLRRLSAVYGLWGFAYVTYATFFAAALVEEHGLTTAAAGELWALAGALSTGSGFWAGALSDRVGRPPALAAVLVLQAGAFLALAWGTAPAWFTVSAAVFGLTAWSVPGLMAAACGDAAGPRLAPAALGFVTLAFGIGQALSPGMAGALADRLGSFGVPLTLAAGVNLVAALQAAAVTRRGRAGPAAAAPPSP